MKILQVITSLRTGGAEHIVVELALGLRRLGHEVDVCTFLKEDTAFCRELEEQGVRVIGFAEKGSFYKISYICRLARLIKGYDLVHTHNTSPQFFAALANIGRGRALITTEHSTNNRRRDKRIYLAADRWMYGRYDHVVCISDIARQQLSDYLGNVKTPISTIENGVDVEAIHAAEPLAELQTDKFVVAMVAGFREAKDQDTLVRAFARLPKGEYELWLVGDGVRRAEVERLAAELNLKDTVRFLGLRTDVPRILRTADVVCMSSHWEGLSLSNLEGMSAGKPFIASDVNGLREATAGAGLLFPHQDVDALANLIRRLKNDTALYTQTARRCYDRALQFDVHTMVRKYAELYEDVVSKKKK